MSDKRYTREVEVEVGGETRRVLLCLWGLIKAEEKGFDVSDMELDEEAEERKGEMSEMLDMLWVGMLPFEDEWDGELTRRRLGMEVTFGDMEQMEDAFTKIVSRQITDDVREKVEEAGKKKGEDHET